MPRLYRLDAPAANIADAFGAHSGRDPWKGGYVAPDNFAPVITAGRDYIAGPRPSNRAFVQPRMVPRLWGVMPPPKADNPARRIATLRNPDSPFWIGHLRNSEFRCLLPATAVMVWGAGTDYEGRRLKHWLALEGAAIFAMLGVWKDEDVPAFALLTTNARGLSRKLGAATMPLVVPPQSREAQAWLHGGWDAAQELARAPIQPPLVEISAPSA
ncbi:MAG: DUF159 family protein [Pseudomonadota bacterium]